MDKIELEIVALSHSVTQSQSYAVVLGETQGLRRLPIVIGGPEAQAIAVALEHMSPSRPLTHDLFKNTMEQFGIELKEVIISNLKDGIFFAQLICEHKGEIFEIDSRTSDALALAVRFSCPVYTYEFILEQAGIIMEEPGKESTRVDVEEGEGEAEGEEAPAPTGKGIKGLSVSELNDKLKKALDKEDYETAAKLRDELNRREKET